MFKTSPHVVLRGGRCQITLFNVVAIALEGASLRASTYMRSTHVIQSNGGVVPTSSIRKLSNIWSRDAIARQAAKELLALFHCVIQQLVSQRLKMLAGVAR